MDRYPPIAEHVLIGDLQTAALVTTDGSVDWFCCSRSDSLSGVASLLDREQAGTSGSPPRAPIMSPGSSTSPTRPSDHPVHDLGVRRS
jgi:GH15 family glucan-1,4-alpha-glucosidase